MRDIFEDEELLVWYDKHQYNLYMGIPQGFKESEDKKGVVWCCTCKKMC